MSTLWPLVNMGVMTMKMISSTSITSTMGVTLMSDTGGGAFFFFIDLTPFESEAADRSRRRAPSNSTRW